MDKPTWCHYYSLTMATERVQRRIGRLLDETEEAISQRDWTTGAERIQDVVPIEPDNQEGQAFLSLG